MICVKETIIVEGKDDAAAVRKAAAAHILTTSGYGLSEETIAVIRTAYERTGIVILTDPDHAGRSIRTRLTELFPDAKHAYLAAKDARKGGDLGVENAGPAAIEKALRASGCTLAAEGSETPCDAENGADGEFSRKDGKNRAEGLSGRPVTPSDLERLGLAGGPGSAALREKTGARLGVGYANAKTFLRRLRSFGITAEELEEAVSPLLPQ